ncbi:MFS transporter [Aliidongia dinghuensis]|uniref:MFS transporter n=1 Tax=Aliidongia dinghuensis TaxID=1867774 RepID=A0A8J2YZT7_9PROT|nr:MFS transporter [Aliidongia dinghuensis]GGF44522.1 MFS transporter [Aliidongia dinghuensis]
MTAETNMAQWRDGGQDREAALDRATAKAMRRLLPFLILMYMLSYLDRANIGFAKQAFQAATGVSDAAFAFGAGVFFIGYAAFEVPSNLMLHRFGARRWMSRIMVTWGLIAAAMIWARGDTSFSVMRLFLGLAEAGFFPGAILYMTYWFPARSRGRILGLFYFGAPLALMFGGPLSGTLLDLDGVAGLMGWQWMFLIEGLLAVAVGVWAYWYLTDRPADARWLTAEERDALSRTLAAEDAVKAAEGKTGFRAVLTDPRLMLFATIYFLIQISSYGVAFYLPTQVSGLLHVNIGVLVGFVSAVPWACAIVAALILPPLAVGTGFRRTFGIALLLCIACGLIASGHLAPLPAVIALCFVTMGIICSQPIFWTFPTGYLGGTAAAGGLAVINAIGNLGGFVAPNVKTWAEAAFQTPVAGLYTLALAPIIAAFLFTFLAGGWILAPQAATARSTS